MGSKKTTKATRGPSRPLEKMVGTVADQRVLPDRRRGFPKSDTGLERRRGPGRRRSDFTRSAEEGEMTKEQFLFLMAIDAFKRVNGKTFPSWSDVLEIIRRLGYRKVQRSELALESAEDWTERADAPLWPAQAKMDEDGDEDQELRDWVESAEDQGPTGNSDRQDDDLGRENEAA